MNVTVTIPIKEQILSTGFEVHTASDGASWSKDQLGEYSDKSGVYILHSKWENTLRGKNNDWSTWELRGEIAKALPREGIAE